MGYIKAKPGAADPFFKVLKDLPSNAESIVQNSITVRWPRGSLLSRFNTLNNLTKKDAVTGEMVPAYDGFDVFEVLLAEGELTGWSLTDDDNQPIPITRENIALLRMDDHYYLMQNYAEMVTQTMKVLTPQGKEGEPKTTLDEQEKK